MSMSRQSPSFAFPVSATRPILLSGKSDHSLRQLLYDFFTVSAQMENVRRHLGKRIGLTGPQYSLMMAVAELQGRAGVSVGQVAEYLHVTGTFVTTESGKLSRKGVLEKRSDVQDGRRSLLSITPAGQKALSSLFPELQQINDIFFDLESRVDFERLCETLERLVGNSQRALALINASRQAPRLTLNEGLVGIRKRG